MYKITRVKYYEYGFGVVVDNLQTEAKDPYEWIQGFRRRQLKKGRRIGFVDIVAKEHEAGRGGIMQVGVEDILNLKATHPEYTVTQIARKLGVKRHLVWRALK
jgi:hypothetical protein